MESRGRKDDSRKKRNRKISKMMILCIICWLKSKNHFHTKRSLRITNIILTTTNQDVCHILSHLATALYSGDTNGIKADALPVLRVSKQRVSV